MSAGRSAVRYGLAGGTAGLFIGLVILILGGALQVLAERAGPHPGPLSRGWPPLLRLSLAYTVGGLIGGAIWGALRSRTRTIPGAMGVAFLASLPVLHFISLAAAAPSLAGTIVRAGALALALGLVAFLSRRQGVTPR